MPRSDYICERCESTRGDEARFEATIGEKIRCPACGKQKWVRRIYASQINVTGHGIAKRVDGITEQAWSEQRAVQILARDATMRHGPLRVVPTRGVPQALAQTFGEFGAPNIANQVATNAGQMFKMSGSRPASPDVVPTGDVPVRQPPGLKPGSKIDRRYRRVARE